MRILQKHWSFIAYPLFVIMFFYLIVGVFVFTYTDLLYLQESNIVSCSMDLLAMVICLLIYYSTFQDIKHPNYETMYFQTLTYMECAYIFFDEMTWLLNGHPQFMTAIQVTNFISYVTPIALILVFWGYVQSTLEMSMREAMKQSYILCSVVFIAIMMIILNLKFHFYYSISSDGVYERGGLFIVSTLLFIGLFIMIAVFTGRSDVDQDKRKKLITYIALPLLFTIVMNVSFGYSFFVVSVLCSVILLFINIYKQRGVEIAQKNEELIRKDRQMLRYKTNAMVSQLQPDFIYNTLGSIEMLCSIDSNKASEATEKFSQYMRINFDSINNHQVIPFKKAIEHLKNYIYLENIRYDINFKIGNIQNDEFMISPLVMQPMVELLVQDLLNDEDGGTIKITEKEQDKHIILIESSHIEEDILENHKDMINNLRDRLADDVNGELVIDIRNKTIVIIRVPFK